MIVYFANHITAKKLADEESERLKREKAEMEEKAEMNDTASDVLETTLVIQSPISKVMRKMSMNIGMFSNSQKNDDNGSTDTMSKTSSKGTPRGCFTPYPTHFTSILTRNYLPLIYFTLTHT